MYRKNGASQMKMFIFRDARTGTTFNVLAANEMEAIIKAQSEHDQTEANKRQQIKNNLK